MSKLLRASSFAAFVAAVMLVLGSARLASAAEDKKAEDKKAEDKKAEDKKPEAVKTGTLSGTVTAADGKPAKDVTVRLFASRGRGERGNQAARAAGGEVLAAADKPAEGEKPAADRPRGERRGQRQQALKETKTNDKGEFTFSDVPVGEYSVGVTEGSNSARERATVKAGETAKVTLALKAREPGRGNRGNQSEQGGDAKKPEGAAK
jgi:hypothetical protein